MNDFPDDALPGSFGDGPANNIDNDIGHLAADLIDGPDDMMGGPGGQQMAPMRPQLTEEEKKERNALLFKIRKIRNSRVGKRKLDAEMMSKTDAMYTDGLTNDELIDLIEDLKYFIGTHEDADAIMLSVHTAVPVIEGVLTSFTPIKAQGFGTIMDPYKNEKVFETIEEISFDFEPKYMSPYQRLGLMMMNTLKQLHEYNKAQEAKVAEQMMTKQATEKIASTLDDLPK